MSDSSKLSSGRSVRRVTPRVREPLPNNSVETAMLSSALQSAIAAAATASGGINFLTGDDQSAGTGFTWTPYNDTQTVTITNASPGVFTVASTTGYYNAMPILFSTTGALPTGLTAGTTYYVTNLGTDGAGKFRVAATVGGADINTSSAGSGVHTARPLIPTTGSATGSNLVLARTTTPSEIINGAASFKGTKDASNRAGEGFSCLITIPTGYANYPRALFAHLAYMVTANFVYNSGTYASPSDIMVYFRDVTNNQIIMPDVLGLDGSGDHNAGVQFDKSVTSVRMCLHIATTNATTWDFIWDDASLGPTPNTQAVRAVMAQVGGDAASATTGNPIIFPTKTYDTHGAYNTSTGVFTAPRSGWLNIHGSILSGSNSIDVDVYVNGSQRVNIGTSGSANGDGSYSGTVRVNVGDLVTIRPTNGTMDVNPTAYMNFEMVPDSLADAGTPRIVRFTAYRTAAVSNTTSGTSQKFPFNLVSVDSHGGFDTTNNRYVAQVAGRYEIAAAFQNVANATGYRAMELWKNGVFEKSMDTRAGCTLNGSTACGVMGSAQVDLNPGEYVEVFGFQNSGGTLAYQDLTLQSSFMQGVRVGDRLTVATSTEQIAFTATHTNAGVTTEVTVPFSAGEVAIDTIGNYDSAAGLWRCSVGGVYEVGVYASTSAVNSNTVRWYYKLNGGTSVILVSCLSNTNGSFVFSGSVLLKLKPGDTIEYRVSSASSQSLDTTAKIKRA